MAARTPRAPAQQDTLLTEAQNLLALNQTPNVLQGGENTPLHNGGGSFSGMTPQHEALSTPNRVLSTPFRGAAGATPGRNAPGTDDSTPMRDKLRINEQGTSVLLTPRTAADQRQAAEMRSHLAKVLPCSQLPCSPS